MGTKICFITDDNMIYIFWDMPWFDYPVFSHRGVYREGDVPSNTTRHDPHDEWNIKTYSSNNHSLPGQVKKQIWDEYEGYYMAEGKVTFEETERKTSTVLKPEVGDMYPLREP